MMSARSQVWGLQPQMPLFRHEKSSIFRVWDSESEQVLESHNCFVDESITAYENIANIEVHSKKETTSTSNHAVNLFFCSHSCCHNLFVSESVCTATLLLQFLLLQQSNSSSSSVSEKKHLPLHVVSLNSWVQTHKSFKQVVWFRWAQFIEPFSLSCITC
jgi:hypothetical protein